MGAPDCGRLTKRTCSLKIDMLLSTDWCMEWLSKVVIADVGQSSLHRVLLLRWQQELPGHQLQHRSTQLSSDMHLHATHLGN